MYVDYFGIIIFGKKKTVFDFACTRLFFFISKQYVFAASCSEHDESDE